MLRFAIILFVALSQIPTAASACYGADTAMTSVVVQYVTHTQYANVYHIAATVENVGGQSQSSDVLQFVDVSQYGMRLDARGLPPLAVGASHKVAYLFVRSRDAGANTTTLDFSIRFVRPNPPGFQDCNRSNDRLSVTF
ncbi:MAG: hypothetical protein JO190_03570 [Candidatus Eremiobacteraeota bacterium]|nr:hypothetical protein [Candidatus Eremiobacteraeota bacterium]